MENKQYLKNLLIQFKAATGIKTSDMSSDEIIKEFNEWRRERQVLASGYISLLENMGLTIDNPAYAEVGKGKYDSVVLPCETTIISPYIEQAKRAGEGRVITSEFKVFAGVPALVTSEDDELIKEVLNPNVISMFMTQNPYDKEYMRAWGQLHNNRNNGIIVGIYGNTSDKDKTEKIRNLRELRYLMMDDYIESYEISDNNYYYAIATDMPVKKRKLR